MGINDRKTEMEKILEGFPKEIQNALVISGLVQVSAKDIFHNETAAKAKLKKDILQALDDLPSDKLMILYYLIEMVRIDSANTKTRISQQDMDRMIQSAYNDGLSEGKTMRIKELKRMREWSCE